MAATQPKVNTRRAAARLVEQILDYGAYTNIVLSNYLKKERLPTQERRFLTQLVYGTVKAAGTIDWYLKKAAKRALKEIDASILAILRIAFYQILYLDKVPERAAVYEAVEAARKTAGEGAVKFVNGVLRNFLRQKEDAVYAFPSPEEDLPTYLALKYSHPRFLVKRWLGHYGLEATEKLLRFDNGTAPLVLRANEPKITRVALAEKLRQAGIETRPSLWSSSGLVCTSFCGSEALRQAAPGLFYIQGEEAQTVAPVLAPKAGEKILDLCAAPGGKSTHLAQLTDGRGSVVSCDIYPKKLQLIEANARWLGLTDITTQLLDDGRTLRKDWSGAFDGVLVDAPCSGLGVLRQRAELRWRRSLNELKIFPPLQAALLETAARYVKKDGRLLYSTCTIEPCEGHYVVEAFLQNNREWQRQPFPHPRTGEAVEELQVLPHEDGIDGGFICLLRRRPGGQP